jgi:hypothetical protein
MMSVRKNHLAFIFEIETEQRFSRRKLVEERGGYWRARSSFDGAEMEKLKVVTFGTNGSPTKQPTADRTHLNALKAPSQNTKTT